MALSSTITRKEIAAMRSHDCRTSEQLAAGERQITRLGSRIVEEQLVAVCQKCGEDFGAVSQLEVERDQQ